MDEMKRMLNPNISFTSTSYMPSQGTINEWRVSTQSLYLHDLGDGNFKVTGRLRYTVLNSYMYGSESVYLELKNSTKILGSMKPKSHQDGDVVELPGTILNAKDYPDDIIMENGMIKSIHLRISASLMGTPGERLYEFDLNTLPILTDNTVNNKTLYEGNVLTLTGNVLDKDNGNVVSVKYNINNGVTRAIVSGISNGVSPIPYNKSLVFKEGKLYDGTIAVSNQLPDNTKHIIKIWGEDDKGGKSEVKEIFFYVVNNRPATLTINPITEQNDLVDTDTILITGNVTDPDGNETTINYKTNSGSFITLNSGQDRDFEIRIPVSSLIDGNNNITIQAKDSYGAITEKIAKLNKEKRVQPLKTAVREYKMIPPDGQAKGILLWIQREVGDLTTKVEIKFGNKPYQELPVNHTGLVTTGLEEDEYIYENDTEESEIYLRITMNRTSTTSNKGIKLISGVFN